MVTHFDCQPRRRLGSTKVLQKNAGDCIPSSHSTLYRYITRVEGFSEIG